MENTVENRILRDYNKWQENEQRFANIFSGSVWQNKGFLKEKIDFLASLPMRYQGNLNPQELIATKVLQFEKKKLEKLLYPNPLVRLLIRTIGKIRRQEKSRVYHINLDQNVSELQKTASYMGFGNQLRPLYDAISKGDDAFSIPVSRYFQNGDSVNYGLEFKKDTNGNYKLVCIQTELISANQSNEKHKQQFHIMDGPSMSTSRAYNLLKGRTVLSDPDDLSSPMMKLDFNDKDGAGNYRIKSFHQESGKALSQIIQELPDEFKLSPEYLQLLKTSLVNGDRPEWLSIKDEVKQKFYMELNPNLGRIDFYNESQEKISLSKVLGIEDDKIIKLPVKNIAKEQSSKRTRNSVAL